MALRCRLCGKPRGTSPFWGVCFECGAREQESRGELERRAQLMRTLAAEPTVENAAALVNDLGGTPLELFPHWDALQRNEPRLIDEYGALWPGLCEATRGLEASDVEGARVLAASFRYRDLKEGLRLMTSLEDARSRLADPSPGETLWSGRARSEGTAVSIVVGVLGAALLASHTYIAPLCRGMGALLLFWAVFRSFWRSRTDRRAAEVEQATAKPSLVARIADDERKLAALEERLLP